MTDFVAEIKKIFGDTCCAEHWTADAGHDDFWCPVDDEEENVIKIYGLIKENLDEALKSEHPYVNTFAWMMKNQPDKFFAGHEVLLKHFPEFTKKRSW